eukprot:518249-Prymnesium_polylepis.2
MAHRSAQSCRAWTAVGRSWDAHCVRWALRHEKRGQNQNEFCHPPPSAARSLRRATCKSCARETRDCGPKPGVLWLDWCLVLSSHELRGP